GEDSQRPFLRERRVHERPRQPHQLPHSPKPAPRAAAPASSPGGGEREGGVQQHPRHGVGWGHDGGGEAVDDPVGCRDVGLRHRNSFHQQRQRGVNRRSKLWWWWWWSWSWSWRLV
ncbi:unnamed protein product, partial [Ectocarpus sp. 13 AM-2016]